MSTDIPADPGQGEQAQLPAGAPGRPEHPRSPPTLAWWLSSGKMPPARDRKGAGGLGKTPLQGWRPGVCMLGPRPPWQDTAGHAGWGGLRVPESPGRSGADDTALKVEPQASSGAYAWLVGGPRQSGAHHSGCPSLALPARENSRIQEHLGLAARRGFEVPAERARQRGQG